MDNGVKYSDETQENSNLVEKSSDKVDELDFEKTVENTIEHSENNIPNEKESIITNKFPDDKVFPDGKVLEHTIKSGKIFNSSGSNPLSGSWNFVITEEGELVLGLRHAFLANRKSVKAAGLVRIKNGKIIEITNESGHYRPTIEEALNYPDLFKKLGIDVSGTKLRRFKFKINEDGEIIESTEQPIIFIE